MVAVATKETASFLKDGFSRFSVVFIFGPDEGLVSENAALIAQKTVGVDAANILRFDGDEVAADPLRLLDEANAIAMFGGMRAIRIRSGNKSLVPALEPLLTQKLQDARIIVEAGDIKKNHALRQIIEKSPAAAALACYAEEGRSLSEWLDNEVRENGFSLERDARSALLASLGGDRKRSRSEIEKLFLYSRGQKTITLDDIEACITDAAALSTDSVIDAAYLGNLDIIETQARRVLADGMEPGVLLGFALRHALLLLSVQEQMAEGRSAVESIKSHRIHWKREKNLIDQASRWSEQRLQRAIQIIGEATLNTRRTASLGDALAIRALWSIALAVSRR